MKKISLRPTSLLVVLLLAHFCSRIVLDRTSSMSGTHNYDRAYGASLSLLAGRGFQDIAIDDSPASEPIQDFIDLKRARISREEFAAYLASRPDPAKDPDYTRYMPLASMRVLDVRVAAILWRIFGIDRTVLAVFYSLFSVASCAALFFIARRLTGSGWAGLAAAALFTISPIEAFINTWSWRDASPMWFTAASLAWFVCGLERSRRPAVNWAAYAVLGMLTVLGIGWRIDALILAPFLGAGIIIRLIAARPGWRYGIAAMTCFAAGAFGVWTAIAALGAKRLQTANVGFHQAFYGDYPRAKLLGIEDSFQVSFCDMQTLDNARQIYRAEHPDREPITYLSPEYCDLCRTMFFEELDYNLFNWIYRFPKFYVQALAGLDGESVLGEPGSRQIQRDIPSPLQKCLLLGDWLGLFIPCLFLIGVLATTCAGRQKLPALLLALFSVYYVAIMLLVLPDQKHIGVLLVPMYVFAGAGIWAIVQFFARRAWSAVNREAWRAGTWRGSKAALVAAGAWSVACVFAYAHSAAKREALLGEIRERAAHGVDAPETLRGDRHFTVAIRPDSQAEAAGYLLKIAAGEHPGDVVCRQLYFPRDWTQIWGRELDTRHPLSPNREQSFFVSCVQGDRLGDPRPHVCAVAIDGDARILQSTRVPLADWNHPQVCTLYFDGQHSPGSPVGDGSSANWMFLNFRSFSDRSPDKAAANRNGLYDKCEPLPAPNSAGRPLRHLIACSKETGTWKIAMSDGWKFDVADLDVWSPTANWLQMQSGNFNGDGIFDLVGQAPDGQWWLARANGGCHEFRALDSLPRDGRYDFVGVGDFNGDGLEDLILRSADGRWMLALSTGDGFRCQSIDGLPSDTNPRNMLIGDFLGNGRSAIAGLDPRSGRWTIASMEAAKWSVRRWGEFPAGVDWRHLTVGDFRGTGQADIAAWDPATGIWTVGWNDGERLVATPFGKWPTGRNWKFVKSGRFGAGRWAGLAAVDGDSGELHVAVSDGTQFTSRQYAGQASPAIQFYVGPFSGGERDDLLEVAADGQLWVGKFAANGELHFESWGRWPEFDRLTDFRAVGVWPEREPGR